MVNILETRINYSALEAMSAMVYGSGNVASRLIGGLEKKELTTYGSLVAYAEKISSPLVVNGVRDLNFSGVGARSYILLYTHLNNMGINLFKDGYDSRELVPAKSTGSKAL